MGFAALRARRFDELPLPEEFSSKIEPTNVPAVFHGAVKHWSAISRWNPLDGGLNYLEARVGSANLEAMLSRSGLVFYGDIRSHERVPISFSTFITSCKNHIQNLDANNPATSQVASETRPVCSEDSNSELYIAQVSILNMERKERCPLETLVEDIETPILLEMKPLASINFWMNMAKSRSSTHYDPHHNLLCVVAGCKKVTLWPPSACPILYPMPVYGEASNHSAVNIEKPDVSLHPRAELYEEHSEKIILHPGDALFIPEGWFHQVDSDDLTIAVNFWWKSEMMSNMVEHMDAYYLRRILNRLVEKEKDASEYTHKGVHPVIVVGQNQMLHERIPGDSKFVEECQLPNEAPEGALGSDPCRQSDTRDENGKSPGILQQLDPLALHVLYELVSLVQDTMSIGNQKKTSTSKASSDPKGENTQIVNYDSPQLESDIISNILSVVDPLVLRKILLGMVHSFPRTLEALILYMLSPKGAEVLTRKFDDMDQNTTKEEQSEFYRLFYGAFDDQFAAMDALLNGKELFAFQAFRNVLDKHLGVHLDQPNS